MGAITGVVGAGRAPGTAGLQAGVRSAEVQGTDLFLGSVIVLVLVSVWRVHIIWGSAVNSIIAPLRVALVATLLGILGWYLAVVPIRRLESIKHLRSSKLCLALLLVVMAGIPLGGYPTHSFIFFKNSYITFFALFPLVALSVRSFRDLERIAFVFIVGALLYCGRVVLVMSVGPSGRLNNLWSYDANDLAFVIVCTLPLAVYFLRAGQPVIRRVLSLAALGLMVVTLVRTGSRGGFLGFLAVLIFLLIRYRSIPLRMRLGSVALAVAILFMSSTSTYWDLMRTILHPEEDYNYSGNSAGGRMETWKRGYGYMLQWPVAGVGIHNFSFAEGGSALNAERMAQGKGWIWAAPHNSFVQVGVELGVTGLLVFVWLLLHLMRSLSKIARAGPKHRKPSSEAAFADALVGSFVGFCVAGFFLSMGYSAILYAMVGMAVGLFKIVERAAPAATAPPPPVRRRQALRPAAAAVP